MAKKSPPPADVEGARTIPPYQMLELDPALYPDGPPVHHEQRHRSHRIEHEGVRAVIPDEREDEKP